MSLIRHNFHALSEASLNNEVNRALRLSNDFLSTAFYFDRDDVALNNLHKFFFDLSEKKRQLAFTLIHYMQERGGRVQLSPIRGPENKEWSSPAEALLQAIDHEQSTNKAFVALCEHAEKNEDPHLSDFVEEELLEPVVQQLKKLADLHTAAKRAGSGLGEYVFDKELFD